MADLQMKQVPIYHTRTTPAYTYTHLTYVHDHLTCLSTLIHTYTAQAPPKKKLKRDKKSKVEKTMESTLNAFLKYQAEAEEKREEERWKKEMELEEKRRKEHELRIMQMIFQRRAYPPYEFNYHDDTF